MKTVFVLLMNKNTNGYVKKEQTEKEYMFCNFQIVELVSLLQ